MESSLDKDARLRQDEDSDDTLSVTSTVLSIPREYYALDSILAERKRNGKPEYLAKWEGYPLERCTWEEKGNFHAETLAEWRKQQARIRDGLAGPFDVKGFEALHQRTSENRKARRREKRRRLEIIEAESSEDEPLSTLRGKKRHRVVDSDSEDAKPLWENRLPSGQNMRRNSIATSAPRPDPMVGRKPENLEPATRKIALRKTGACGRGPSRRSVMPKPQATGAAVLDNWAKPPKQRRTAVIEPGKLQLEGSGSRTFKRASTRRRVEQRGRNEPAPNPDKLTFVDLKDGKTLEKRSNSMPMVPARPPKTPFQMIQEQLLEKPIKLESRQQEDDMNALIEEPSEEALFMEEPAAIEVQDQAENLGSRDRTLCSTLQALGSFETMSTLGQAEAPNSRLPQQAPVPESIQSPSPFTHMESSRSKHGQDESHSELVQSPVNVASNDNETATKTCPPNAASDRRHILLTASLQNMQHLPANIPKPLKPPKSQGNRDFAAPAVPFWRLIGDLGMSRGYGKREDMSDIYGAIVIGSLLRTRVTFRGLCGGAKQLFLTIKEPPRDVNVSIHKFCSFQEYRSLYHQPGNIYYGAGHVVPSQDAAADIDILGDQMDSAGQCGMFFAEYFTFVLYPVGSKAFAELDERYPVKSPPSRLRFLMRTSMEPRNIPQPQLEISLTSSSVKLRRTPLAASPPRSIVDQPQIEAHSAADSPPPQPPLPSSDPRLSKITSPGPQVSMPWPTAVSMNDPNAAIADFKKLFNIDYWSLLPKLEAQPDQTIDMTVKAFFLYYPEGKRKEHDCLTAFLGAARAQYYSWYQRGEWEHFASNIKAGVVLIHESLDDSIHAMAYLRRLLARPSFNLYLINLQPDPPSVPGVERIFPYGGAVLIPDSLILTKPHQVLRIFRWFRKFILPTKSPRTWKFLIRPRFREWILSLVDERSDYLPWMSLFVEFSKTVPWDLMDKYEHKTPLEDAAYASAEFLWGYDLKVGLGDKKEDMQAVASNDDILVDWFGMWSLKKFKGIRRFFLLHDEDSEFQEKGRKRWGRVWPFMLMMTSENFISRQSIGAWETKTKKEKAGRRCPSTGRNR